MAFDVNRPMAPDPYSILPPVPTFVLTSTDVTDGLPLRRPQTEEGGDIVPQLQWSGIPAQTSSFLVTCYDPDAPRPGGFWHWLVADVPVDVTTVAGGRSCTQDPHPCGTKALYLLNSAGLRGFMGAAPPHGDRIHRYYFAVHALDVAHLALPQGADTAPAEVAAAAVRHTIARAVIMGTHVRPH
jgi:Raf kinase inhibitor-like YbhB/YbcL family protein